MSNRVSTKPKRAQEEQCKNINKAINPEKHDSSREERMSSLPEGEWAVDESQRGMAQDEKKFVCRGVTPWKTGIFLRGRVELFTRGWVSWCSVPKRDDAENEKMTTKQTKEIEKDSIKHLFWCNLMYKKDFSFSTKYL